MTVPTTFSSWPKCFVTPAFGRLVMPSLLFSQLFGSSLGICTLCCIVFIVVFRCGVYPTWILYSTLYDATLFIEFFPAYYFFNSLLVTLQVLHIFWTYFLFKVGHIYIKHWGKNSFFQAIYKAITKGGVDDQRSDSEPSDAEPDDNENNPKKDNWHIIDKVDNISRVNIHSIVRLVNTENKCQICVLTWLLHVFHNIFWIKCVILTWKFFHILYSMCVLQFVIN